MVVGIAGKGERIEPQGIDHGQLQHPQRGHRRGEVGPVEGDDVVTEQEVEAGGERVEFLEGADDVGAGIGERTAVVTANGGQLADARIARTHLRVDGKATPGKCRRIRCGVGQVLSSCWLCRSYRRP
ncbi:MAG: hypothetical protein M5U09_13200 [Gammaproteobacteria bacterium]|nr:hypothetical protein [Gammaproteobacteria bacterium]